MRLLCLDVGERRIGLAVSDPQGMMAVPVGTIERTRLHQDIAKVVERAEERGVEGILVGMPFSLSHDGGRGKVGPQARRVKGFVKALRGHTDLPIYTSDERFSTAEAERLLRQAGRQPSRHRGEVDAIAATVILQEYLDKMKGSPPP